MAEAFAEGDFGREAKVAFQGGGISVGGGDITWLPFGKLSIGKLWIPALLLNNILNI